MKWFLKILSTIALLFCLNTVFAQKIELSNNPDEFLGQLKNLLYETPNKQKLDRIKENFALFEEYWNSQRFNNTEKQQIITFAQQLIKDKMRSNSAFPEFFITVSIIGSTSLDHPTINDWLIYNEQIYKKNKKKYYQQLLDLQSLLQENKVGQAGNMLWYIRKANYKMEFQPDFRVNVSKCNLVCSSKNDSLVISNTKGYFNAEGVWHGQGGVVDWKRFDDNDTKDI